MGPEEVRILELERRVFALPVASLERRVAMLEQGLGQMTRPRVPPAPPCSITWTITISDSTTASPVSGATVTLSGPVPSSGTTDGSGQYVFTTGTSGEGSYTVTVTKSGYTTKTYPAVTLSCGTPAPANSYALPPVPSPTFTVFGCTGALVAGGDTVSIYDGVTLLATGNTNTSGQVTLTLSSSYGAGNYTVQVTPVSGRFASWSSLLSLAAGSSSPSISLSPASGYVCHNGCNYPVSTTLQVTDNYFSSYYGITVTATLTYSAGAHQWAGGTTVDYQGCTWTGCGAAAGVNVTYHYDPSFGVYVLNPYGGGGGGCPNAAGTLGTIQTNLYTRTAVTCPGASTAATFSTTWEATSVNTGNSVYCLANGTRDAADVNVTIAEV